MRANINVSFIFWLPHPFRQSKYIFPVAHSYLSYLQKQTMSENYIAIIGAGPTGLGCAWRLKELGYDNFHIYEANNYVGGLAASFKDNRGFTWDIGGHVLFSHYKYYDDLFDRLLEKRYLNHTRTSWIRLGDRFIPYPFQNNLRYLPTPILLECLIGLHRASQNSPGASRNFREWILEIFGEGIARHFMFPYNEKAWAFPLEEMSKEWIAERVSVVDFERVLKNIMTQKDDVSWGPNSTFKFPEEGGTGALFRAFQPHLKGHISLNKRCTRIETKKRLLHFDDGSENYYNTLVSTAPLPELISMLEPPRPDLMSSANDLAFTSGVMVGLGFSGPSPSDKNWVYFPDDRTPIYRLTYFSNYSPKNVPDENHFSLMGEVSYSPHREIDKSNIINEVIEGFVKTGIIPEEQKKNIVSTFVIDVPYSYPVPTLQRNAALGRIIPALAQMNIHARGRHGLCIYEIGNMDHSVMQGVEMADALLDKGDQPTIAPFNFLQEK